MLATICSITRHHYRGPRHFDHRWPIFSSVPVAAHFISYEPALGPLTLGDARPNWVICGGESDAGDGTRVMDPAWARSIRDECAKAGVVFFMKQMTRKRAIPDDLLVRQFP